MKSFKTHLEESTKIKWKKVPDGYHGNKKVFKHVTSDGKFEIRLSGMDSMKMNKDGSQKVLPTIFDKFLISLFLIYLEGYPLAHNTTVKELFEDHLIFKLFILFLVARSITSRKSDSSLIMSTWHSGSPIRILYSIK